MSEPKIKVQLTPARPGEIALTLTATMSLEDWRHITRALENQPGSLTRDHPIGALFLGIRNVVAQATASFTAQPEK